MIKKVFSNRNRVGWQYDATRKKWTSWHFDIWIGDESNKRRKRESGFRSKSDAESAVARIRLREKEIRYGFVPAESSPTLREVLDRKLSATKNHREYTRSTRIFNVLCGCVNIKDVSELRTSHLQTFVDRRLDDALKPQSVNRELNSIGGALSLAKERFSVLEEWTIPKLPRLQEVKARRERVITAGELTRLLTYLYRPQEIAESSAHFRNRVTVGQVFQFANLTAARKGELCKLRWDQVDWDAGVIQIIGTKTEKKSSQVVRYLKITPTIAGILRQCEGRFSEYVFTRGGGEITDYYEILGAACRVLGLRYGKSTAGGFVTHDGRHTAVTRMLQAGVDLPTIGSITGQGDKTMIMRYGHASIESRNNALESLENSAGNRKLGLG